MGDGAYNRAARPAGGRRASCTRTGGRNSIDELCICRGHFLPQPPPSRRSPPPTPITHLMHYTCWVVASTAEQWWAGLGVHAQRIAVVLQPRHQLPPHVRHGFVRVAPERVARPSPLCTPSHSRWRGSRLPAPPRRHTRCHTTAACAGHHHRCGPPHSMTTTLPPVDAGGTGGGVRPSRCSAVTPAAPPGRWCRLTLWRPRPCHCHRSRHRHRHARGCRALTPPPSSPPSAEHHGTPPRYPGPGPSPASCRHAAGCGCSARHGCMPPAVAAVPRRLAPFTATLPACLLSPLLTLCSEIILVHLGQAGS